MEIIRSLVRSACHDRTVGAKGPGGRRSPVERDYRAVMTTAAIRWLSHTVCGATLFAVACGSSGPSQGQARAQSNIKHLVVLVQENHTFDSYFGQYCSAPTGSQPSCNEGPACCEAGPATDPTGALPVVLDDFANGGFDPDHSPTAWCVR